MRRHNFLAIAFLLVLPSPAQENAQAHIQAAEEESKAGNYVAAMTDLQAALALESRNADGWYQMGVLLGQVSDFRAAEDAFRRAIGLKPDFSKAHYGLGLTFIANPTDRLDWPEAIAEFREALKIHPDYPEALNLLGAGLTAEGKLPEAIKQLERAVALRPSFPDAHFNFGLALEKSQRLDAAINEYRAAIEAKGKYPEASTALGELLLRMKKDAEAESELKRALAQNPDLMGAHVALARVLRAQGKVKEASVQVAISQDLSQRKTDALQSAQLSNSGLDLAAKGDLEGARTRLKEAISLKPDYGVPHYNLGLILADRGDFEGAQQELTKAISLLPLQAKPWLQLSRVLRKQGQTQQAFAALDRAAHLAPSDAWIQEEFHSYNPPQKTESLTDLRGSDPVAPVPDTADGHLAFATQLADKKDFLGAAGELLRSLQLTPDSLLARGRLAAAFENLGQRDRAILEYYKVLTISPANIENRLALGRSLASRGDFETAVEELRSGLSYDPNSSSLQAALEQLLRISSQKR